MPASICCTNCRTKYSLLNREAGCSNCALSFCKKCLGYRAIIPNLSDKPLTVCYTCYKTIEAKKLKSDAVISSKPIPLLHESNSSSSTTSNLKNWWGEGLPPPSFRNIYVNAGTPSNFVGGKESRPTLNPSFSEKKEIDDLEERRAQLRNDAPTTNSLLSIEEIEERLAKLRGCDVEVIRNPRSWFAKDSEMDSANNVEDLMKIARDRARLEEIDDEIEKKDLEELEERRKKLIERDNEQTDNRESVITNASDFSLATREELKEIDEMLENARKKVAESKEKEESDAEELRRVMSKSRQKSLDAMQWNEKINKEMCGFWEKQNEKSYQNDDEDDKSLDEEVFKKIIHEAENALDEPITREEEKDGKNESLSPKKKGFFNKIFRRDSKDF